MTGLEHLDGDPFQTNIVLGEEEARYCVSRRGYTTSEASISSRAVANAVASICLEQDEVVGSKVSTTTCQSLRKLAADHLPW